MENGLPHQSADWFAMTGFLTVWQKSIEKECHCEEPPKRRRRGNPHPLKPAVSGALSAKMKHFGERIA
ncbi:MAG: hypothetical protein IKC09_03600, partial [Oscillospiraceae bacterium]|nr:hypothetical protein [Oscillospiraceae bacterium]